MSELVLERRERLGVAGADQPSRASAVWAFFRRVEPPKLVLIAICLATLLFAAITPPFQSPDENQHYLKALLLSEGGVLPEVRDGAVGADLPRAAVELRTVDFPSEAAGQSNVTRLSALQAAWNADSGRPGTVFAEFPNAATYPPTLYLPQAAGIALAEAIGMPRLGGFYLGRLLNALAGLALLIAACRLIPFGRLSLLGVATLPTVSYQAGSLSPDALINGLAFLGLALSLSIGFAAVGKVRALLFGLSPLLALAKGIYLPLLLAGVVAPADRRDVRPWLSVGAVATGAAVFLLWMAYSSGTPSTYSIVSRKTGEQTVTAPLQAQLGVILADPVGYVRVLVASVAERMPVYALQIVGRFGWNTILLPLFAYPLAALMLIAAVRGAAAQALSPLRRIWWLLLAGGLAALIETALYLTGTPLGADYIQGTQGRYFVPLLPLVLLALMPSREKERRRLTFERIFAASALLLLATGVLTAIDSFWLHGFVPHEGLPPMEGVGRALLLPSPRW